MTTLKNTALVPVAHLALPPLALGSMYWGTDVAVETAHDLLDVAIDRGATLVDTANNYAFWRDGGTGDESETCLGAWFASRGPAARGQITLATKIGARPSRPGGDLSDTLGLRPEAVAVQLRDSLRRLGTDYVDLVYAHIDDPAVPLPEVLGGMQQLVADGLAGAIAASNLTADRLRQAMRSAGAGPAYAALQNRFTYLATAPDADLTPHVLLDDEVIAAARDASLALLGYSPLLGGAYTRADRDLPDGFRHDGTDAALATLRASAQASGLDAGQTVLAWMGQRTHRVIPIVGVSQREQLISAVDAVATPLAPEILHALDRARTGARR